MGNVTYDSRDETMYHDNNHDDHQDDHSRIQESNNDSFERKEETSAPSENPPPLQEDDVFDNFKTGPFPKKRTSNKVKREKDSKSKDKTEENKKESSNWLKTKPIIKKSNKKKTEATEKSTEEQQQQPKTILFATLVPALMRNPPTDRVRSILGSKFRFNFNPGAKRIDVISRVMFPGTFACLNIAYW